MFKSSGSGDIRVPSGSCRSSLKHAACGGAAAAQAAASQHAGAASIEAGGRCAQKQGRLPARQSRLSLRAAVAHQSLRLVCVLGLLAAAAGSPGDRSHAFRRCHSLCTNTGCTGLAASSGNGQPSRKQCSPLCRQSSSSSTSGEVIVAPLALRLWRWDCPADCSYLCMWQAEASWPAGTPVQKYHGKWPFTRWLGMQEPASVLFSLLNLAAHALCLARLWRLQQRSSPKGQQQLPKAGQGPADGGEIAAGTGSGPDGQTCRDDSSKLSKGSTVDSKEGIGSSTAYPYKWLWAGYMLLSVNAWLWSAVFHSRDTRLTERLDYFSAALLVFYNLFLCVVRIACLRSPGALLAVAAPVLAFLTSHFRFMLFVLFDYGYHVKVCIAAGAAQSLLWLGWALGTSPPGRRHLLSFIALVNACMLLEVLDFPPLWHVLDAHSLWHLATVPLVHVFYQFIETDVSLGAIGSAYTSTGKAKRL